MPPVTRWQMPNMLALYNSATKKWTGLEPEDKCEQIFSCTACLSTLCRGGKKCEQLERLSFQVYKETQVICLVPAVLLTNKNKLLVRLVIIGRYLFLGIDILVDDKKFHREKNRSIKINVEL